MKANNSTWWQWLLVAIALGFLLCLGVGIVAIFLSSSQQQAAIANPTTVVASPTQAASPTEEPTVATTSTTEVPEPTAEPDTPTDTAEPIVAPEPTLVPPTATPEPTLVPPTATPEPTLVPPTATPVPAQPVVLQGVGQSVTDEMAVPGVFNRIEAQHNGSSNFQVSAYESDGNVEYLINEIGSYNGAVLLYTESNVFFEITADGEWSLSIQELVMHDTPLDSLSGSGDWVTDVFVPSHSGATPYRFTHDGSSNFQVSLWCAGGVDFVQNEIGSVDNQVVVDIGEAPCFWEIHADGNWSFEPLQ
jgi:cytoskeletal protein RodZ